MGGVHYFDFDLKSSGHESNKRGIRLTGRTH